MCWKKEKLSAGLGSYTEIWDKLNAEYFENNPFFDSCFVNNLLLSFGNGGEYLFIHNSANGAIDGLLILTKSNSVTWRIFTASQAQIAPVMLKKIDLLDSLFMALGTSAFQIDLLNQDPNYSYITSLDENIHYLRQKHALTIGIRIDGNFDAYWTSRNKNLKKNMRRYFNRANKDFREVSLVVRENKKEVRKALKKYSELEGSGWKGKVGTAILMGTEQEKFYDNILCGFSEKGCANVYELYFDKELVASRLTIFNSEMLIILKTTYNEEYSSYAPGRLLLNMVLKREFELGRVTSVELYTNASNDQLAWATHSRYIEHVSIFKNKAIYILYNILILIKRYVRTIHGNNQEKSYLAVNKIYNEHLYHSIEEIPECDKKLFRNAEKQYFDLSYAWFQNLEKNGVSEKYKPMIYTVNDRIGNKCQVILPLMSQGNMKRLSSFATYYTARYYPILEDEKQYECLAFLFHYIRHEKYKPNLLEMSPLPSNKFIYKVTINSLKSAGWIVFTEFYHGNWYLPVNDKTYSEYYRILPGKLRNTIERKKKKFYTEDNAKITLYKDQEQILDAINKYIEVYQKSWKAPEPFQDFIPGLVRLLSCQNELRLGLVLINNKPVAAQIWVVKNNTASIYKLAYDMNFSNLSVGSLLTDYMMKYVIDTDKVKEVDFLVGDEAYKQDWMTHRRELCKINAYNPSTAWGMYLICKNYLKKYTKSVVSRITFFTSS